MAFDFSKLSLKLPANWKTIKISEIADINLITLQSKDQLGYIHYIDISSVSHGTHEKPKLLKYSEAPSRAKRVVRNNDILISTVRPNLKQHTLIENAEKNLIASTGFCIVSAHHERTVWFLYAFITSNIFNDYLVRISDGGTYPTFNPTEVRDAVVPWPDVKNMIAINSFIKAIYTQINLNREINQILEKMAQALFKSWFVDFDPVIDNALDAGNPIPAALQAKVDLRQAMRARADFTPLPDEIRKLFPAEFEESELGWIPKGWRNGKLGDVAGVLSGFAFKGENFSAIGEAVLKIKNINADRTVDIQDVQRIPQSIATINQRFVLKDNDLIMAMTGATIGKFGMLTTENNEQYYLNQRVAKFEPKIGDMIGFIYCSLNQKLSSDYVVSSAQGSAQPNISAQSIAKMPLLLSSGEIIIKFNIEVESFIQNIIVNRKQNMLLATLRDTLLPKLISGELDLEVNG